MWKLIKSWFTEKRRLRSENARLRAQVLKLINTVNESVDLAEETKRVSCRMIADLNVAMQGGREWAQVYNHLHRVLTESWRVVLVEETLRSMNKFRDKGEDLDMVQNPAFNFPTTQRVDYSEKTIAQSHRAVHARRDDVDGIVLGENYAN